MQHVLLVLAVTIGLAALPSCLGIPPHVIFIVADDLGWNDVGWHNPAMLTPNLDKYAAQGVILNSSYVQPVCTPSRNCFMTGLFPYHTGLQKVGYKTHIVGKWHLGFCNWKYTPMFRGFDTFFGYYNGAEDYYTHIRDNGFDFRFNDTVYHGGDNVYSAVPKRFEDLYSHIQTKDRRIYCGMVSALDEAFGNVTQALEDSGIADNMLLIFTTDNGGPTYSGANNLPLRGAKTTTWEGGTKGAAFVYSKNLFKRTAYTSTELIHAVDWFPTILEAAGAEPESGIDGVSQLATITSGSISKRTEFVYNIDDVTNMSAIRYGDYKLIKGGAGVFNGWYPLPKLHASHLYNVSAEDKVWKKLPEYMLFNIKGMTEELV
ncbi:hypothetical protein BaRGS_00022054 [Batillaria attramentaria]|uniref:Sulfatase N-terminal domain-containing protein n=1 Tax=Batillaria attramentaria TaxID=370345 RepID=A0ABD0KHE6_9CAEN